ncbi:hypothetical protein FRC19_011594 [Serendipita sp. 401]|nr:hypothetical protein FRC19_011594 [Serendipita sp. 401]
MAILISKLPSVRELDVLAPCDKTVSLPNLTYALRDFHEVRHFRLIEETSRTRDKASDVVHGLSDDLICALTKFNGKNLTSFVFDGDSFASAEAFTTVRDHMPRLSTLLVRSWIGPQCFQILQEDTPWACRDTLQVLSLQNCQAITADIVARGLSTKHWATNLRILELIRCGVHGSSPDLSHAFPLAIPTLQRLTLEHPSAWEIDILAKLPARHVTLTLLPRECAKQLVQEGMFPGMEKLTVTKLSDGTRDDRAIEAVCQQRGVELVKDPKWIIGCDCGFTE